MTRTIAAALCLLLLAAPPSLPAKGSTVKITVEGAGLARPIEIMDTTVQQFHVWSGPGVSVNHVEQTEGFIIEWSKGGITDRPTGLRHYKVSFYVACKVSESSACRTDEPSLAYVVFYEYDPSAEQGFIYLPGKDEEFAELNTRSIYHGRGFEGNWFRATHAWESLVRPLIANAIAASNP